VELLRRKDPTKVMNRAAIIINLQRKYRETYTWEHAYKRGEMSAEELQEKLLDTSADELIKEHSR
jgi:hypothetical protein